MDATKKRTCVASKAKPAHWAVYFTHTWGTRDDHRQSADLTYQECREHLRLPRKIEQLSGFGHRYVMRRKPGGQYAKTQD